MKIVRYLLQVSLYITPFLVIFFFMPDNPILSMPKACAYSQWGPNCPGVDAHHQSCPSGRPYPAGYPACIDSVGITVPIVVTGLTGNDGSISIKAHAKGPGSEGWPDACVDQNVVCLLREADSETQGVSINGTYMFYIDPIGCTSGNCNDTFSITAQFSTSGTQYTCERTDDRLVDLNKNGQDYETPPVGIVCTLPVAPTPTPTKTPTPSPTPTKTPTPSPTPPPSVCPVPSAVTNIKISCPDCGL